MSYIGEYPLNSVIDTKFTTVNSAGAPAQLAGSPVVSIYKDNDAAQRISDVTLTVDFDSVTGLNHLRVTCTDPAFYAAGSSYSAVITTGTVGGTSVVGYTVAKWRIGQPVADQVWGSSVGSLGGVSDSFAQALAEIWSKMALLDAAISSRLAAASYTPPTTPPTVGEIADAVWDEPIAGHVSAGSTGEALASGGGGGASASAIAEAVWGYSVGLAAPVSDSFAQAIGEMWNRVDVPVSSRSSHSAADVWSVATRVLTAGTNIALAKGTGVTGFNDLDAAGVRAAVGLASANLDTQFTAVTTLIDAVPTAVENADALLARNIAGGSNGGRDVTSALRFLRNRWLISGSTLTVYQENDSTTAWTASLSTDAAAVPIIGTDPS